MGYDEQRPAVCRLPFHESEVLNLSNIHFFFGEELSSILQKPSTTFFVIHSLS